MSSRDEHLLVCYHFFRSLDYDGSVLDVPWGGPLHLELRFVTCNGAEENQAHRCDPYDLRVQEQPLFLVCSRIVFLLLWIKSHRSKNIYAGADQK